MRVLLCGGGTAGHVNPALAIAETIEKNIPNSTFAYVVTRNGIENTLVKYKKYEIDIIGLKKRVIYNIRALFLTYKAIRKCKKIIREYDPDIVIGTGGYSSFPVIYAAHKCGVKTLIHESNAYPGKTTRILAKYADKVLLNYKESIKYFNNDTYITVTGVPYLKGFIRKEKESKRNNDGITILCFGGSLGAEKINYCALDIAENIIKNNNNVTIVWGCGTREYDTCVNSLKKKGLYDNERIILKDYIYEMPIILSEADIVICRAGAISIAEMSYNGKCTIFVPSPNVTDNHQYKNAKVLSDSDSAILVEESNIGEVKDIVKQLICDKARRETLEKNIQRYCVKNSNKLIFNEIIKLTKSAVK